MDSESDCKVKDNGKYDAEFVDNKLMDAIEIEGTAGKKTELLPGGSIGLSPSPANKGRGLRKWRRIRRESGKETNNNFDSNRKRGMTALPVAMKQRSEGSSSSTNAMSNILGNVLNHISLYGDLSSGRGPDFASRADSENSEDQNSRSSTAASAPRGNQELPVVNLGFNLSGKNSGNLVQLGNQQDISQNVTKKARAVKIKKENSISSMESDSRSSNFFFMQGANSMTSNGRPNGRSGNYDEHDSDDGRHLNDVSQIALSKNDADYENVSHKDLAGENSWEVKEEKIDDHVGSENPDALIESIMPLHLAQEALEREVQKLRDVGKDDAFSSDEFGQPSGSNFVDKEFQFNKSNEIHLQSKLEEAFIMLELKNNMISELESTLNLTKVKTEYDELLTQRIAAEVEYLVISKTVQNLKSDHIDRINLTVKEKKESATSPEQEDAKKLKSRVWRYVSCFIIQLGLLLVVFYAFVLKFSSKTVEVIPT